MSMSRQKGNSGAGFLLLIVLISFYLLWLGPGKAGRLFPFAQLAAGITVGIPLLILAFITLVKVSHAVSRLIVEHQKQREQRQRAIDHKAEQERQRLEWEAAQQRKAERGQLKVEAIENAKRDFLNYLNPMERTAQSDQ